MPAGSRDPKPETRKVARPPYEQLVADLVATNFCAVGRKYGVSDNAVRKWVRWYKAERERAAGPGSAGYADLTDGAMVEPGTGPDRGCRREAP